MIKLSELDRIIPHSSNPDGLQALLQQLVGQPFLFIRVTYGEELTLHFGKPLESHNPRVKNREKGSYIVGARASEWFLRPASQAVLLSDLEDATTNEPEFMKRVDIHAMESGHCVKPGSVITKVSALCTETGFVLELVLSDGSKLYIWPPSAPGEEPEGEIADWEVFTPHQRYLRVGPGLHWAYLDSVRKPSSNP